MQQLPTIQTNTNNIFKMQQATSVHTDEIMSLLMDAAKWFQSKGSDQWSGLLEGIDSHRTDEAVTRGDVFIATQDDVIAGMVMLLQQPSDWDRNLWDLAKEAENEAVYLHRLATNRAFQNQQLGKEIFQWCQDSIRFSGIQKIRLDCLANNPFLNDFYQSNGFIYVGEKDGYSLYEYMYKK